MIKSGEKLKAASVLVLVPTVIGAGIGAVMSLVAKPQCRNAIIGTGAGFGALIGTAMFGYSGGFQESKEVGVGTPPRQIRFP